MHRQNGFKMMILNIISLTLNLIVLIVIFLRNKVKGVKINGLF